MQDRKDQDRPSPVRIALWSLGTASIGASVYHGYKRNKSAGWAVAWGVFGAVAPVLSVPIALAQGFGKPK